MKTAMPSVTVAHVYAEIPTTPGPEDVVSQMFLRKGLIFCFLYRMSHVLYISYYLYNCVIYIDFST